LNTGGTNRAIKVGKNKIRFYKEKLIAVILKKSGSVLHSFAVAPLIKSGDKESGCQDLNKARELGFPKADVTIRKYCQ